MKHFPTAVSSSMLLALSLSGGNAMAEGISAKEIYAGLPEEVARDGKRFAYQEQHEQTLRHRIKENDPDQAKKERNQLRTQQDKKAKHQYQYREMDSGQHRHKSGSFGAFSGKGSGGGGGGRGRR